MTTTTPQSKTELNLAQLHSNHRKPAPFQPIEAQLTDGLSLLYRTPAAAVGHLIPGNLELVTRGGFAFWHVSIAQLHQLRPAGVPVFSGLTCNTILYQLVVQAMTEDTVLHRGYYTLKQQFNRKPAALLQRWKHDIRDGYAAIDFDAHAGAIQLDIQDTAYATMDAKVRAQLANVEELANPNQPSKIVQPSCFATERDAIEFMEKPVMHLTTSPQDNLLRGSHIHQTVDAGEHFHAHEPIVIDEHRFNAFDQWGQTEAKLELALRLKPRTITTEPITPTPLLMGGPVMDQQYRAAEQPQSLDFISNETTEQTKPNRPRKIVAA